jgi:hypothetical protein
LFAQRQLLNSRSHEQRIETSHLPELKSKLAFERSFAPIQKNRSGIFAASIFHLSKLPTESPPYRRPPPKPHRNTALREKPNGLDGFVQAIQSRYVLFA